MATLLFLPQAISEDWNVFWGNSLHKTQDGGGGKKWGNFGSLRKPDHLKSEENKFKYNFMKNRGTFKQEMKNSLKEMEEKKQKFGRNQ